MPVYFLVLSSHPARSLFRPKNLGRPKPWSEQGNESWWTSCLASFWSRKLMRPFWEHAKSIPILGLSCLSARLMQGVLWSGQKHEERHSAKAEGWHLFGYWQPPGHLCGRLLEYSWTAIHTWAVHMVWCPGANEVMRQHNVEDLSTGCTLGSVVILAVVIHCC